VPRPSFKATGEQRRKVKSLAALGLRQEQITTTIGLRSPKTLRKHFREELTRGTAEANAAVARVAFEMATSGKWPVMTRYWISVVAPSSEPVSDVADDECDSEGWEQ
jgi:hypothetical protein